MRYDWRRKSEQTPERSRAMIESISPQVHSLFGEAWLLVYAHRQDGPGYTMEKFKLEVDQWVPSVLAFVTRCHEHRCDMERTGRLLKEALKEANFDLNKFPKQPKLGPSEKRLEPGEDITYGLN
jgi:hypothetical protein